MSLINKQGNMERRMKQRIKYYDYLRVIATFAVVVLHVSGIWFSSEKIGSIKWLISLVWNSGTRFAVPIFVMISGAVFLGRDIETKKIYTKYIFRIVTAFAFWSLIYAITTDPKANIKGLIVNVVYGHYHMWFLYMIMGLYILVPILRVIVQNKKVTKYFLGLAMVFVVLIPQAIKLAEMLPYPMALVGDVISTVIGKLKIELVAGFVGYFVAGYYLHSVDISKKCRKFIYVFGVIGFVSTVVFTAILCIVQGKPNELFFESFSLNIVLFTMGVFVFGKYELEELKILKITNRGIEKMAEYSFGVYLVHALILNKVNKVFHFESMTLSSVIMIPVISIIVWSISMTVSALLHRIPFVKKYFV